MARLIGRLGMFAVVCSLALFSANGAEAQPAKAQKVPQALVDVGELGENVYDMVKAGNWTKANEHFKSLQNALPGLPNELKDGKPGKTLQDKTVPALASALSAKDKLAALRSSNQVTKIAADLTEPFNPQIPSAVTRLDFYGRQMEIGVAAKDQKALQAAAKGLSKNWDMVKSALKGRGEAEAKRFEALVGRTQAAASVEDYAALVKPVLDEVDVLENVFKK